MSRSLINLTFERLSTGPSLNMSVPCPHLPLSNERGWQSSGGPHRHPSRMLPTSLTVSVPSGCNRLHFIGIFAMWAASSWEPPGSQGAMVHWRKAGGSAGSFALVAGMHYDDAGKLTRVHRSLGDGSSLETLGFSEVDERCYRVDMLSLDVPQGAEEMTFVDLDTPASFVVFDILAESDLPTTCPFREASGGVSLAEIGAIIRLGEHKRYQQALSQLSNGIRRLSDLDEARSLALTFLAVTVAALLELGGGRELHRLQLDAVREFDRLMTNHEIADRAISLLQAVTHAHFVREKSHTDSLIEEAVRYVGRHFARDLNDAEIARNLGLSTSHFRYLFKESTGMPFHKYVVASRLECARQLLLESDASVSEIAATVGFSSAAHFTRAFNQRFGGSPKSLRSARANP